MMSQEEKFINPPDPEVISKPLRRRYTADYKLRMLQEYDACEQPGEKGALLRREGTDIGNVCARAVLLNCPEQALAHLPAFGRNQPS